MKTYSIYYVDDANRMVSMLVCSLKKNIDWCEDGLRVVTWKYNIIGRGRAESLNDVFRHYSVLNIDRRRKKQLRTVHIGDIIVFDDDAWIVSAFWFLRVPSILAEKIL
jgi:hypothetical protein